MESAPPPVCVLRGISAQGLTLTRPRCRVHNIAEYLGETRIPQRSLSPLTAMPLRFRTSANASRETSDQIVTWVDGRRAVLVFEDDPMYPLVAEGGHQRAEPAEPVAGAQFSDGETSQQTSTLPPQSDEISEPVSLLRLLLFSGLALFGLKMLPRKFWQIVITLCWLAPLRLCEFAAECFVRSLPFTLPVLIVWAMPGGARRALASAVLGVARVPLSIASFIARMFTSVVRLA